MKLAAQRERKEMKAKASYSKEEIWAEFEKYWSSSSSSCLFRVCHLFFQIVKGLPPPLPACLTIALPGGIV